MNSSLSTVLVNTVTMAVRAVSWITHSSISKITEVSGGPVMQVFFCFAVLLPNKFDIDLGNDW